MNIIFLTFSIVVLIQLVFYFIFGKFAFAKSSKPRQKNIAVSILVCAKNESEHLSNFIPSLINQDYPEFEIVLINDGSYDNSLEIMESFAEKHNNIKVVDVTRNEAFWGNKKYAITLGIKAAKHDYLLFTDADCKPISKYWVKRMCSNFSNNKAIILGYGSYAKIKNSILNKLIRFETLLTAIQYFSFAKLGIPYMGVGRNLAYRKELFFNANGFMSHMNIKSGDDDLFINQIATKKNTTICFSKSSFTESQPNKTFNAWFKQKRRHITTAKYYKPIHKFCLSLFYLSQLLFWSLATILLVYLFKWETVASLILLRLIVQFIVFSKTAKKLNETGLIFLLPLLEIFLIVFQLTIFITNLISKPNSWK